MIEQNQEKMTMMMTAMEEIRKTSQQVVGIIQTIEEIADQTNLLSLNASIEARAPGKQEKASPSWQMRLASLRWKAQKLQAQPET